MEQCEDFSCNLRTVTGHCSVTACQNPKHTQKTYIVNNGQAVELNQYRNNKSRNNDHVMYFPIVIKGKKFITAQELKEYVEKTLEKEEE